MWPDGYEWPRMLMLDLDAVWLGAAILLLHAAGYALGIVLHEFGHAGMAWLLGFHPRMIRVGVGPLLLRLKLGAAWFEVRPWPLSGRVTCLPRPAGRPLAVTAYLLAGIIANAIVLIAMSAIWIASDELPFWALAIGGAQFALILTSVIPVVWKWRGTDQPSDMYKIWRLLRHPESDAVSEGRAALMRGILPAGTALPPPSPDSPEIMYQLTRRDLRTDPWVRRDASAVLQRVLLRGRLPPAERALVLDRLALFESLKGDDASKELMDAWSAEAVTLANGPYTLVTCGGVLIALGRPAEAEALLTPVLASATAMGRGTLCEAYIRHAVALQRVADAQAARQESEDALRQRAEAQ
jgi:hypothetical protein